MAEKKTKITGRAWVIKCSEGKLINDIDTDMIYHNAHLAVTDVSAMGRHAFGNLEGWKDFPNRVAAGDIIVTGDNFGCGSSRQHAVDCFVSLGVAAVVVRSVGAIYKRNAINCGFPLVVAPQLADDSILSGDTITLDLESGIIEVMGKGKLTGLPFSRVQMDIYKAGSLFAVNTGI